MNIGDRALRPLGGIRQRLARYLAQADERAVRAALGMTPELAASAAARCDLAPEALSRVRIFLAAA